MLDAWLLRGDQMHPPSMLDDLNLSDDGRPLYQRLADAIAARIVSGELAKGDKLPPQRALARTFGINVTTVTRALSTLRMRGLLETRAGGGTLVASCDPGETRSFASSPSQELDIIDLSVNRPATPAYLDVLSLLLPHLARSPHFSTLQDYHPPEGPVWARVAIARWIASVAGDGDPGRVVVTAGAQHALDSVLKAIAGRGDVVLADEVTYQGIGALCRMHGLNLVGIGMDRAGMLPEALDLACMRFRPRAVFLVPTLHNPTTITLDEKRRRNLAAIARRHNVLIIEDDVYRPFYIDPPPSLASIEPELTVYVGGLSKCVAPGIRLGFVVAPRAIAGQISACLRINCWSISPLTALVATQIIESGDIDRIIAMQREELRLRQVILCELLSPLDVQTHPTSTHAWLRVPDPWRGASFARACMERGVAVLPGDAFAVGREPVQHGVRINVGAARSREDLRAALSMMARIFEAGHLQLPGFV